MLLPRCHAMLRKETILSLSPFPIWHWIIYARVESGGNFRPGPATGKAERYHAMLSKERILDNRDGRDWRCVESGENNLSQACGRHPSEDVMQRLQVMGTWDWMWTGGMCDWFARRRRLDVGKTSVNGVCWRARLENGWLMLRIPHVSMALLAQW